MLYEVQCVTKAEGIAPDRIKAIGGIYANGTVWKFSQEEAIRKIEKGNQRFYVQIQGGGGA